MHMYFKHKKNKYHGHGNRTLNIDQYAVKSGLAFVNPDLKIIAGISSLVICLLSDYGITSIMIAAVMVFISFYYGKIKAYEYWHMIMIPVYFILFSTIVLLVDVSNFKMGLISIPLWGKYLVITKESIGTAVTVSIKAVCSLTCLYMISLSTPVYEIIGVLQKCKIPEVMIELMYLIYRFIFILLEAYHNMKTAADTRLGYTNLKRSYHSFFGICSNLFIISFKKASRSFDAMESRCYDGTLKFLTKEKPMSRKQILLSCIYIIIIITILVLERIFM